MQKNTAASCGQLNPDVGNTTAASLRLEIIAGGKDPVNKHYLLNQRKFWNTDSLLDAMFNKVFTGGKILEFSTEEKWAAWNRSAANSVNKILTGIPSKPGWRVLEIGCGVGRLLKPMRERFSRVDGVDIAEDMIRFAREYLSGEKQNGQVLVNNGYDLSVLDDALYDFVFSMIVFQHIRSVSVVRSYFREAFRVLKPMGLFKLQVYDTSNLEMGRSDEEAQPGRQYGMLGNGYTPDQLESLLVEAGFDMVETKCEKPWIWATVQRPGPNDTCQQENKSSRFTKSCFVN